MLRELRILLYFLFLGCSNMSERSTWRCPSSIHSGACNSLMEGAESIDNKFPLLSTTGFEVEGSIPLALDYRVLAEGISTFLKTRFPGDSITIEANLRPWNEGVYIVIHQRDGWEYRYTIEPEKLSIDPKVEPEIKPVEISAPIMRTRSQVELFFELIEDLRRYGLKSRPNVGGNHVHWGVSPDTSYEEILRLYKAVGKLLDIFQENFAFSGDRKKDIDFPQFRAQIVSLEKFVKKHPNTLLRDMRFDVIENRTVLRYVEELGTIELRIFNSNLNPAVNQFYFDFASILFAEWGKPESVLFDYLLQAPEPEVRKVIFLMGLDWRAAETAFQWAKERLSNLQETLKSRSVDLSSGQFVFPSSAEKAVERLRADMAKGRDLQASLNQFKKEVKKEDRSIGLYQFLIDRSFENLPVEKKREVISIIEQSFQIMPFLKNEIWAIRSMQREDFVEVITDSLWSLRSQDEALLHPLFFRLDQRFRENEEAPLKLVEVMSASPGLLERFLDSYSHYLRRRVRSFDKFHLELLKYAVQRAQTRVARRIVLRILNQNMFEIKSHQRHEVPELFNVVLESIKDDRLLVLRFFRDVVVYTRNDSWQRIGNIQAYIDIGLKYLARGNYPKLLQVWLEVLNLQSKFISPETLNDVIFPVVYKVYGTIKSNASGMELLSIKWAVEEWKKQWNPENWEKLKELIKGLK